MNILHINTNYEVSTIYPNMLNEFSKISNVSGRLYYPVVSEEKVHEKTFDLVDISPCLKKTDRLFYFNRNKKLSNDVTNLYDIRNFDITLAYSLFSNGYLAYTLFRKYGIPYFVIVQNTDINMYFKKMIHLRRIGRKIIQAANKVIFISEPYKDYLINNFIKVKERQTVNENSVVIPFGIDNFWFANTVTNKKKDDQQIKLLYVGKINKNKNIISSIKACELLINQNQNVSFTIVGNIEDKLIGKTLMKYDFVNYIPFLQQEELLTIYRDSDIFIMPSIKESFGLVYAEAMSQGLPIIYSSGQGFDKHFKEGTVGLSVEPTNIEEIVNSIFEIYNNYNYYSKNCIDLVEKFKWKNIINQYKSLFEQSYNLKDSRK